MLRVGDVRLDILGPEQCFLGTDSDPNNDSLTFSWDFGDGGTASGASPTHTYSIAGTFAAKVTANDGGYLSPLRCVLPAAFPPALPLTYPPLRPELGALLAIHLQVVIVEDHSLGWSI